MTVLTGNDIRLKKKTGNDLGCNLDLELISKINQLMRYGTSSIS